MAEFFPVLFSLMLIFIVGVFVPLIASSFLDTTDVVITNPVLNYTINNINASIGIPFVNSSVYSIGLEDIIGEPAETSIINYIKVFQLIPSMILIPLIILVLTSMLWALMNIIADYIPF